MKVSKENNNWIASVQDPCQEFHGTRLMCEWGFLGRRLHEQEGRVQPDISSEQAEEESSHLRWAVPRAEEALRG